MSRERGRMGLNVFVSLLKLNFIRLITDVG